MKLFVIFVIALALFQIVLTQNYQEENDLVLELLTTRMYEAKINETIEGLKDKLNNGDPEAGIPSFNPLQIEHLPINLSNDFITSDLVLDKVSISGIPDFVLYQLKFAILGFKLTFKVLLNKVVVDANYDGEMTLLKFIPVYGKGHLHAEIEGIEIGGSLNIKTPGGHIQLGNTKIDLGVASTNFVIQGLINDEGASGVISQILTEVVPTFINDRKEWITKTISPVVETVINSQIQNLTLDDILGGLTGGGSNYVYQIV